MRTAHLLIISERAALGWVLRNRRMAFPAARRSLACQLDVGAELMLYTTRSCFHNPTKHRGRVMGLARTASPVVTLDEPVEVASRTFHLGCDLDIDGLAEPLGGVELAPLVPRLSSFPRKDTWAAFLRRPLVPLTRPDAVWLKKRLAAELSHPDDVLAGWLDLARPRRPAIAAN